MYASLMTFSAWSSRNKPTKRRTPPAASTLKTRLRRAFAGLVLVCFLVLRGLAANPGASPNWLGLLGGATALAGLFWLMMRCNQVVMPPSIEMEPALASIPPSIPVVRPGVIPPKNGYRAEVNLREAVYHRGIGTRIAMAVFALFFLGMAGSSVWIVSLALGLIFEPGMHMRDNPALALMMLFGCGFFLTGVVAMLASAGPRELRVLRRDRTYTYRFSPPMRSSLLAGLAGQSNRDELGWPWQVVEHRGNMEEVAGIALQETTRKSTISYSLFLRWKEGILPAMRVGYALKEEKARALQAQAADDLGVPLLPDEAA